MEEKMRSVYTMSSKQMKEWREICESYAKREKAELVFVNETSMGLKYQNEELRHIYIDELVEILKKEVR